MLGKGGKDLELTTRQRDRSACGDNASLVRAQFEIADHDALCVTHERSTPLGIVTPLLGVHYRAVRIVRQCSMRLAIDVRAKEVFQMLTMTHYAAFVLVLLVLVALATLGLLAAEAAAVDQPYDTGPVIHIGDAIELPYTAPYETGPVIHESDLVEFLPYSAPYETGPVIHTGDAIELPYTAPYETGPVIHESDLAP